MKSNKNEIQYKRTIEAINHKGKAGIKVTCHTNHKTVPKVETIFVYEPPHNNPEDQDSLNGYAFQEAKEVERIVDWLREQLTKWP